MSIINSNRLKERVRISTEPSQIIQAPNRAENYPYLRKLKPKAINNEGDSLTNPQISTSIQYSNTSKPLTNQLESRVDDYRHQPLRQSQQTKMYHPRRKLKLQLPKEGSIKETKPPQRILSKDNNSSTESIRIHKIRSNVAIENRYHLRPSKQPQKIKYRYQQHSQEENRGSTPKLDFIHRRPQKKMLQSQAVQTTSKKRQAINHFYQLQQKIAAIQKEQLGRKQAEGIKVLKLKNMQASVAILFRALKKKIQALQQEVLELII